jgi:hypothetical protein
MQDQCSSPRPCLDPRGRCNIPLFNDPDDGLRPALNAKETLRLEVISCRASGACDTQLRGACQHVSVWLVRHDVMAQGIFMEPSPELDDDPTVTSMVCHHVLVMN